MSLTVSAPELARRIAAREEHRAASDLCERIVPVVMDVAWLLRDEPMEAAQILADLDQREIRAFAIVAAAAINVDLTPERLLGWTRELPTRALKPCGTHSAFNRHVNAGEKPCEACVLGERSYQQARKRVRRRTAV